MNKKGFTVVELMTTFVLISMIALLLIRLTITLKEIYINGDLKTVLLTKQGTMTDKIYKDLNENKLTAINSCENNITNCIELVYDTGIKIFKINKDKKTITYDNYTIKLVKGSSFGNITIDKYNNDSGNILSLKVPINNKLVKGDYGLNIVHQINSDVTIDSNINFDTKNTGITVTFDPNGGTVDKTVKNVTLNEKYGSLPIPKREGYTFLGWNGKNKIKEINNNNVTVDHFGTDRTTHEYKKDENFTYVRINGYQGDYIDTSWRIIFSDKFKILNNRNYTLSFYARSKNAIINQYFQKYEGPTDGKTGIYSNNDAISNIKYYLTNNIEFPNDGNWNKISYTFPITSDEENGVLIIGNDVPNLHGTGSYIDIGNVQLEEGDTATEYEPYYVTYSTKVTQNKNHTLTAIWKENK